MLFATSALFFVAGPVIGSLSGVTRANVPAAAFGVICPALAAVVVAARTGSLRALGQRLRTRPHGPGYIVVAIVGLPAVVALSALLAGGTEGFTLPGGGAILLILVYLVGALAEEIGWTGFLLPRLLRVMGEVGSALVIGGVWALWHVIPYAQAGHPPAWIVGQCVFSILFRVLLVRLTVASGGSVWLAVVCHAAYNVAWALSPHAGEGYDPWITAALTAALAFAMIGMTSRPLPAARGR